MADFVRELKKDNFYNIRIRKDDTVVFFGDLDHYYDELNTFINALKTFFLETYNIQLEDDDIKFTQSDKNTEEKSYHYSIPKFHCTASCLKKLSNNL